MPSPNAVDIATSLIAEFEGFRAWPYPDTASPLYKRTKREPWGFVDPKKILSQLPAEFHELPARPITTGFGRTLGVNWATPETTKAAEMVRLREDVQKRYDYLRAHLVNATDDPQKWAAMVSLAYNIGDRAFLKSTVVKKLLRQDMQGAADAFLLFVNAGGQRMPGLVKRRERERDVFLGKVSP